jgi:hypothetical protein
MIPRVTATAGTSATATATTALTLVAAVRAGVSATLCFDVELSLDMVSRNDAPAAPRSRRACGAARASASVEQQTNSANILLGHF